MTSAEPPGLQPGAGASRAREWAAPAVAALLSLAALGAADLLQPRGAASADTIASRPLFRRFGSAIGGRGRVGDERSEVRLVGLWPESVAAVELDLTAKVERRVRVFAGGRPVAQALVGPEPSLATVPFEVDADGEGTLSLGVTGLRREGTVFRVLDVRVQQRGPRRVPAARAARYGLFGALSFLLARRRWTARRAFIGAGVATLVAAVTMAAARLQAMALLPWVVGGLGFVWASLVLADLGQRALHLPRAAGRWVAAGLLFRVGLAIAPGFGSVDAHWHTHRLWTFAAGGLVLSGAPGVEVSPYPPALYAILRPFITKEFAFDYVLLRLAMALMEGLAPLVVLAIVRAAGAREAASGAAAAMAAMPEGVLVLAKGIAANIFGSFATLLFVLAVLRHAHRLVIAGLLALVFLSHAAVAITVGLLLVAWWGLEVREGALDRREAMRRLAWTAGAAAVAWLAYYREVPVVLQEFGGSGNDPGLLGMRWYRAGKVAQDVVLKLGLGPAVLAVWGWRARREAPAALRRLLAAWLLTGAALALVALVSPFPLRFEYFLVPAIAMAAGLGAERGRGAGRAGAVEVAWAVAMAIQIAVGLLWLAGWFEIIAVILESPRWPFPVRL
jgi:hypothetical protein